MTRFPVLALLALAALAGPAPRLRADYPLASHRYLADPASFVVGDRVYLYCSDDDESPVEGSYNIPDVVCVSSTDLKNWTDHGTVFRAATETAWAKKTWAPAVTGRDGKFYLYFGNGGGNIGVVVANHPTGPFKDVLGKSLIEHGTPGVQPAKNMWLFDPGVFVDDDGQAYLYFGGNGDDNVRVARLKRDMVTLDGEIMKMNVPNFFEAAWVIKRNGLYYFAYSTTPKAGMRIDYLTSGRPTSGFTYRGILADQPPLNHNNNHAAEFLFKGRWYHAYHNRIVATEAKIPTGFRRNLALEELDFNEDGSIRQVSYTTDGVAQRGHLDPYAFVEAETFAAQKGVETGPCSEGGMNLTDLQDGDWVKIAGVDFGAKGARKFKARIAGEGPAGAIELRLGGPDGTLIGSCTVRATGGGQTWADVSCKIAGATGVQDLYLKFTGTGNGGQTLFNVNRWAFE